MRAILAFLLWVGLVMPGSAQSVLPAPPVGGGERYAACAVVLPDWATDAERTVWGDICATGTFDLFTHAGDAEICAPEAGYELPDAFYDWALSERFMTLVLTDPVFVEARPTPSARFNCAYIPVLDLSERDVAKSLVVENSLLGRVTLTDARIDGDMDFDGSDIRGVFSASGVEVARDARFGDSRFGAQVSLGDARIDGLLGFARATLPHGAEAPVLDLHRIKVGAGGLFLRDGQFGGVDLVGAQVGGDLSASDSTFTGPVFADSLSVGDDLFLSDGASFSGVYLVGARVGGALSANGSTFTGLFKADGMAVSGGASLRSGSFGGIDLIGSTIAGLLQLEDSRVSGRVDLSDATIGVLMLWQGGAETEWGPDSELILRNARAGSVQARMGDGAESSWTIARDVERADGQVQTVYEPVPTDLTGFRYDSLGGLGSGVVHDLALIDAPALIAWVKASVPPGMDGTEGYRPQPYRALETALRNMGAEQAATEVAYARLIHRADTRVSADRFTDFRAWFGQSATQVFDRFLQYTIGFGVYPQRAFYWFLGLVAIGTFLAYRCKELCKSDEAAVRTRPRFWDALFYSLENAIPLMEPSADHARIEHSSYAVRTYFHVQKVLGFVLASVLIGALTLGG